jgi:hypothetical protein
MFLGHVLLLIILIGSIPTEIGNMTSLTYLVFTQNLLTGVIPSELQYLQKLKSLDLNNNRLSGTIPFELANLTGYIQFKYTYFLFLLLRIFFSEFGNTN